MAGNAHMAGVRLEEVELMDAWSAHVERAELIVGSVQ